MNRKKWVVSPCDRDAAATIAENCGVEPFAAFLLCSRGMTDEFEIESFLYDTDLIDPYTLPDMEKAVERVNQALENGERITVFGDYDCDGVTSTALLYSYLSSRGANVDFYIPDRSGEGYGMNLGAIDILKSRGTNVIITVDNGISAVEEIAYAKTLGIDVVVTDHHRVGEVLPDAVAVVDPHREDSLCEFSDWAGVGVAFKFVSALDDSEGYELLEQYGDIIALGTVADIVSLKGENRIIVRSGIAFMNAALEDGTLRTGLKALLDACGSTGALDSSSVAYRIAPRVNAAGRMGSAERALKLLLTENVNEAKEIAEEVSNANAQRQATETEITASAIEYIENAPGIKHKRVIVVEGDDWHQGVIGIVASRLVEKYGKPCIVISKNGDVAKGSGRSIDGFSLYDALSYCGDILVQYGGHVLAAGLTVDSDKIDAFREKINEYAVNAEAAVPTLKIDCKLNPSSINVDMLSSLQVLEPFGAENPQPLFGLYNMEITAVQPVGSGKHLRITVKRKNSIVTVIMFSVTLEEFPYKVGDNVDLAVKLSENEFQGKVQVSIQAKAIKLSGVDDDEAIASIHTYEDFCADEIISDELKTKISVNRELCGSVYKFVKANNGWNFSSEVLCYRLGLSPKRIAACQISLDALTELGILNLKDGKYTIPTQIVKNPLENSKIFQKIVL
ncbi:MAG: single-stranded-DNA-specific exonuclease RecJ [Acutalibacteraceae bacterium]|nr:single-stranded-DNA-specific exonuclease RecJ [Acutalibacteraceae bacterium]